MSKLQRYVYFRGQVFHWEEKEPFVSSGRSVRGALETSADRRTIKCHECGEWLRIINAGHLRAHKGLTTREYKEKHGLRGESALISPATAERFRTIALERDLGSRGRRNLEAITSRKRVFASRRGPSDELRNERGLCRAQTLARVKAISKELRAVPRQQDIARGLLHAAKRYFGTWGSMLRELGMEPYRERKWSQTVIIELVRDFWALNARVPRSRDWGGGGLPTYATVCRYFGNGGNLLKAAGLGDPAQVA